MSPILPIRPRPTHTGDRKSTRLNPSHPSISYAVFCLKKKKRGTMVSLYTIPFRSSRGRFLAALLLFLSPSELTLLTISLFHPMCKPSSTLLVPPAFLLFLIVHMSFLLYTIL